MYRSGYCDSSAANPLFLSVVYFTLNPVNSCFSLPPNPNVVIVVLASNYRSALNSEEELCIRFMEHNGSKIVYAIQQKINTRRESYSRGHMQPVNTIARQVAACNS